MARRYPWWQWALVGLAILILAWGNYRVWSSLPTTIDYVDQAVEELQRAIDREGR